MCAPLTWNRIQEYSTESLLTTFLPYHSAPVFLTLMSILPAKLPQQYMFLQPYVRSLTQPPRAALVQATIARPDLLSTISAYTLDACRLRKEYPTLISFWGGVMVQTVNGLLDKLRSGRKSVQADNDQAIVSQVMGTLKDSLLMKDVPGIQIASYMILTVLAAKSSLGDNFFSASMDQVVHGWTSDTVRPGLVCLCILAQQRSAKQLPSKISRSLLKVNNLVHLLQEISQEHRIDKFANGLALSLVERLEKKGDLRCLPLVRDLIGEMLLQNKQLKVILKALLVAAYRINDEADPKGLVRKELGSALVSLARLKDEVGDAVRAVIDETDLNIEQLELRLDALIRPRLAIEGPMEDTSMASNGEVSRGKEVFDDALERLLAQHSSKSSCLISEAGELFDDLCSLFLLAAAGQEDLEKVNNSPVLGRSKATTTVFFFSFYIRVWSGPHPSLARAMAIELVKDRLKDADVLGVDFQAILPYAVAALSDVSKRVRRAAADLLTVMDASCGKTQAARRTRWAQSDLYSNNNVIWMDYDEVQLLLRRIIIPALEECVFDEHQIYGVLKSALDNSRGTEEDDMDKGKHLSRAVKTSILKFFASHVIGTPVLLVKIRLLRALNQVSKVGSTTRTDLLLPVLQWWAGTVTPDEARSLVAREKLDEEVVDRACVDVVVASDGKGLMYLMQLINTAAIAERPSLLSVVFSRLSNLWTSLKKDVQFSTAQKLLELCDFGSSSLPKEVTVEAAVVLQQADLSSDVLVAFLESAHEGNTRAIEASTSKRRQKNHRKDQDDSVDVIQRSPAISTALDKTTFVLELVQEAKPAIELLESLFAILADLQQLRIMVGSELGYMQNLALSSLLAIMPLRKADGSLASGTSVSHGDILATCIQSSNTPTVINTALLLVARLARTAPDVVLHSVMPILTFMGGSVLRQADDYSAHVVNQTIKEVIPPLIDTFKKKRRNLMASTADLLSSFVVAYEHIPPHRKHDTFVLLIQNLGPEDFLFAVLAMFVDKYGTTDNGFAFLMDLLCSFPIEVQLHAMVKLIDLVSDLFKAKPGLSAILLGKHETEEPDEKLPQKIALRELALIPHLLSNVRLRKEIALLGGREDDMQAAKIRHIFADLLEGTLTLADVVRTDKALHTRCGDALSSMLNLLSTAEFINSVETLLDRPSITLRQKVLRALEARVERESVANLEARAALLAFLPQLTAVIRESEDINYKQTAVMCVDRIAEKYGKKDLDAVAAAAATIAGDFCLGQSFQRLRIMALLCLASLVDVLQDSIVPILPSAMPRALSYLRESVEGATQDAELHNAAYAFLTALAQHLPFMVSGDYLDQILECSSISAVKAVEQETRSQRLQCLQFLAKLADAKSLFSALLKNWDKALGAGPLVRSPTAIVNLLVSY